MIYFSSLIVSLVIIRNGNGSEDGIPINFETIPQCSPLLSANIESVDNHSRRSSFSDLHDDNKVLIARMIPFNSRGSFGGTNHKMQSIVDISKTMDVPAELDKIKRDFKQLFDVSTLTAQDIFKSFVPGSGPLSPGHDTIHPGDIVQPKAFELFEMNPFTLWRSTLINASAQYLVFKVRGPNMHRRRLTDGLRPHFKFIAFSFTNGTLSGYHYLESTTRRNSQRRRSIGQDWTETTQKIESLFRGKCVRFDGPGIHFLPHIQVIRLDSYAIHSCGDVSLPIKGHFMAFMIYLFLANVLLLGITAAAFPLSHEMLWHIFRFHAVLNVTVGTVASLSTLRVFFAIY